LAQVNQVEYGLTCSIWTNDLVTAHRAAGAVEAGVVWINEGSKHFLGAPFGGYKQSGVGREEGIEELLSFTREKNIHVNLKRRPRAHLARRRNSHPRPRTYLGREGVVDGPPPVGHALVVGVAAERLDGRSALRDAIGIGIGPVARRDLVRDRRRPRERDARAGEVAQTVEAPVFRFVEHLEKIH